MVTKGWFGKFKGEELLMNTVSAEIVQTTAAEVPFQPATKDIWEKKYRLVTKDGEAVDKDMDDTYMRVARALADVEETDEKREATGLI